jgi:hypothetical protein
MKKLICRHPKLSAVALLALLLLGFIGWLYSGRLSGYLAAHFDVSRGRYKILMHGLLASSTHEYRSLLKARYGVDADIVAGCVIVEPLRSYAEAYNAVMVPAVNCKFGRDVFEETLYAAAAARRPPS